MSAPTPPLLAPAQRDGLSENRRRCSDELGDDVGEGADGGHLEHAVAQGCVVGHRRVVDEPVGPGLGVQPVDPARPVDDGAERLAARVAEVVARRR